MTNQMFFSLPDVFQVLLSHIFFLPELCVPTPIPFGLFPILPVTWILGKMVLLLFFTISYEYNSFPQITLNFTFCHRV